jgi:hypothetical protein
MLGSLFRPLLAAGLVASAIAGCSGDDLLGSSESEIGGERTWKLSPDAVAAGKAVRVEYDAAPVWRGTSACSGKLREGARALGEFLSDRYVAIDTVGGYACRRNTADSSRMSVHGTGRALDLMIPKRGGAADSARGDIIANWLVMNAQRIGVQLIIWNHTVWRSNGTNTDAYGGPNPHIDHIHVELTNVAARKGTPWFATMDDGDAGSMDASRMIDGAADDDDASTTPTPTPDASPPPPPKDAGTKDSGGTPAVDASPAPTPDSGTGTPDDDEPELQGQPGSLPPDEADPGGNADGYDFEVPEGESAPEDALGPQSKRRSSSASDEEVTESQGCSATPLTTTRNGSFALFGVLGIALALTRRSKRS